MSEDLYARPKLNKTQKTGLVLLVFFGIFAVGLGILQIRNTMYRPFALNSEVPPIDQDTINTIDALKNRDTDHDGLNDFDEIFIYGTSPYLADTDSDGTTDGMEASKGENPLCNPKTGVCVNGGTTAVPIAGGEASTTILAEEPSGESLDELSQALTDPVQIRQMLLSAGVDKKILDSTTDKELMNMVQEIMSSTTIKELNQ